VVTRAAMQCHYVTQNKNRRRDATQHDTTALRVACCCCKTLFRSLSLRVSAHSVSSTTHNTQMAQQVEISLMRCVMTRGRGDILLHVSPMTLQTTFRRIRKEKRKEEGEKEWEKERKRHFVILAPCPTAKPATKKDDEEENFNISSSPFRSAQHNNKL